MFILLDRFLREAAREPTGATRTLPFRFTFDFVSPAAPRRGRRHNVVLAAFDVLI